MSIVYRTSKSSSSRTKLEDLVAQQESPKEKVNILTRIGNLFTPFEIGAEINTFLKTGDLGRSVKQYVSETARGLGSVIPFLDVYTKPNELAENREGFREVLNTLGMSKKGPWDDILGTAGDIFLDPGNLLLVGLFKTGVKGLKYAGKGLRGIAENFDVGKKLLGTGDELADVMRKAFIPGTKIPAYNSKKTFYKDLLKYEQDKVREQGIAFAKKLPDEASFNKVTDWIETGGKTELDESLKPVADELITYMRGMKEAEMASGLLKKDIQYYFAHILKSNKDMFGFKKINPFLGAAKKRSKQGLISELKDAMGDKIFEENPAMIATLRGLASKKALNSRDFLLDIEKSFGVKGKIAKIIDGVDYVPFKPEGGFRFFPVTTEGGKVVPSITRRVKTFLLPKEIAEDMTKIMKTINYPEEVAGVFRLFDKVQNLWKASVTSYFPAYHARNAVSNIFVNYLAGVNNPMDYKKAWDVMHEGVGEIAGKTFENILDLSKRYGVLNQGFWERDITKLFAKELGKQNKIGELLDLGRKAGTGIENNARMALFINQLEKGIDPAKAAETVKKFLFDYSDLTDFEQTVMKRIFPFYTWTRKAIPLMIGQLVEQPRKFKPIFDIVRNLKDEDLTEAEKALLPEYIKNTFAIQLGRTENGEARFLSSMGLPVEVLARPGLTGEKITEMLSPLLKIPLELTIGTSFFTKKKIKEDPFFYKTTKIVANVPILKQYLQAEEGKNGWVVNPQRMFWLKSIIGRFISTGEKITDEDIGWFEKVMNSLTGVKTYSFDVETARYFKEKEIEEEQLLPMVRKGEVSKFERYFVPKD